MDLSIFEDGTELLSKEKDLRVDLNRLAKDGKEFNKDPKVLKRVKDYVHYYMSDWAISDPFTPMPANYKCKLVQSFRKMRLAILDLKHAGKLNLLDPILSALDVDGIHISIDDDNVDNQKEINQIIDGMSTIQGQLDEISNVRKDLAEKAEDSVICTKECYNEVVKQLFKIFENEDRIDDAVSKISEKYILNSRDNIVFNEFVNLFDNLEDTNNE